MRRDIGDYHFIADSQTGLTMRWGKTIKDNPIWAPVPELADISISNHCSKGCSYCYRKSTRNNEFMRVEQYCQVLDSINHPQYGNVFQVAIGMAHPLCPLRTQGEDRRPPATCSVLIVELPASKTEK